MANWAPSLVLPSANYITLLDTLASRDIDAATMAETPTNPPTGYLRFSRGGLFFEEWNGSVWISRTLSVAGGGTGATTLAGARAGLGLGTIATQNNNAVNITGGTITGITAFQVSGIASADQFVGTFFTLSGPSPTLEFIENDQAANAQRWALQADGQIMQVITRNDDNSTIKIPFYITRTGDARFSDTLYVNVLSAQLSVNTDLFRRLDGTNFIINAGLGVNAHWANIHEFKNLAGSSTVIKVMHNSQLTSSVSGSAVISGGYSSPVSGKLIIGDGTGYNFGISKRQTGGTTDLFLFADNGDFRADVVKSLNSLSLMLEGFTGGLVQLRLSGTPYLSISDIGISTQACLGLGGNANYSLNTPSTHNLVIAKESIIHLVPFASGCEITGIAGGYTGRVLLVVCNGTNLNFISQDGRSSGNNQFLLPTPSVAMNAANAAVFIWDSSISKWVMSSRNF